VPRWSPYTSISYAMPRDLARASSVLTSKKIKIIFIILLFYLILYGFCIDMPEDDLSTGPKHVA
jgi:hypothetical protein